MREGDADLDLAAVRAFVAVAEDRYFSEAAAGLGISQQAISKRIARLESDLGTRLFARSRTGADLTEDGEAFLPHARALVGLADQAVATLRGRRRALRVDVLDTRLASIDLIRAFHESAQGADIEIRTSNGLRSAREALARGTIDAAFCRQSALTEPDLVAVPAYLEPLHLLVGRDHPLAARRQVEMASLAGATVWMPGNVEGSEWAEFYRYLGADFGIHLDTSGPDFGWEHFVTTVAENNRASFIGEGTRIPEHPNTIRIPVLAPVPMYPWSLLHHQRPAHPTLLQLLRHISHTQNTYDPQNHWLPTPDRAHFPKREDRQSQKQLPQAQPQVEPLNQE